MKLNTLTEKQRLMLLKALARLPIDNMTEDEQDDYAYLNFQLEAGKGTG